jgi:hypothetical protein
MGLMMNIITVRTIMRISGAAVMCMEDMEEITTAGLITILPGVELRAAVWRADSMGAGVFMVAADTAADTAAGMADEHDA